MPGGAWANVPRSLFQPRTRWCAAWPAVLCGACAGRAREARVEQVCAIPYGCRMSGSATTRNGDGFTEAAAPDHFSLLGMVTACGWRSGVRYRRGTSRRSFEGVVGPPWIHVCRTPLVDDGRLPPDYHGAPWAFAQSLVEIAVDSHGRTFLLVEPNSRVLVFGPEPEPVLSRRDASGFTYELGGWGEDVL